MKAIVRPEMRVRKRAGVREFSRLEAQSPHYKLSPAKRGQRSIYPARTPVSFHCKNGDTFAGATGNASWPQWPWRTKSLRAGEAAGRIIYPLERETAMQATATKSETRANQQTKDGREDRKSVV